MSANANGANNDGAPPLEAPTAPPTEPPPSDAVHNIHHLSHSEVLAAQKQWRMDKRRELEARNRKKMQRAQAAQESLHVQLEPQQPPAQVAPPLSAAQQLAPPNKRFKASYLAEASYEQHAYQPHAHAHAQPHALAHAHAQYEYMPPPPDDAARTLEAQRLWKEQKLRELEAKKSKAVPNKRGRRKMSFDALDADLGAQSGEQSPPLITPLPVALTSTDDDDVADNATNELHPHTHPPATAAMPAVSAQLLPPAPSADVADGDVAHGADGALLQQADDAAMLHGNTQLPATDGGVMQAPDLVASFGQPIPHTHAEHPHAHPHAQVQQQVVEVPHVEVQVDVGEQEQLAYEVFGDDGEAKDDGAKEVETQVEASVQAAPQDSYQAEFIDGGDELMTTVQPWSGLGN